MKWMIKGANIMTMDETVQWLENGDIVIDGGEIANLGRNLSPEQYGVEKILPAQDKLAIPGLVNAHMHSHDRFDKGRFDNLPLEVWMAMYNPPLGKRNWTPRECYLRTLLTAMEMLKTGTTTVIDDVVHGVPLTEENIEAVFQAYQDIGMRARISIAYADRLYYQTIPYLEELLPDPLKKELSQPGAFTPDDIHHLWRKYAQRWRGRVGFVLAPSAPMRCTDGFLEKTWMISREYDLPVIVHFLETKVQVITSRLFYGKCLAEYMQSLNILTPQTVLIHGVWVSDHDLALIRDAGASIVHNPVSNLKLGSGIAPIRKMLDLGINVGLGTDNNNANDSASLLEAMKMAALLNKVREFQYARWVGAQDVIRIATLGGARCGGLHRQVGSLAVGMKADIVLLDLHKAPFFPRNNALHQLVFCENGESVDTVIVEGKTVVEGGKIMTVNEPAIIEELSDREEEIKDKIRQASARAGELEPYLRQAYFKCVEQEL